MWRDTRLAVRRWLRQPVSTLLTLGTLALGIGVAASVLSLVRAALLRPLPFTDPSRLVRVTSVKADEKDAAWPVSYPDFLDWRARSRSFSSLSAFTDEVLLKVPGAEGAELISGEMVSASYFSLLGVEPALGRVFLADEDTKPGANNVAVLGGQLWRQRFHGDPAVLGKTIDLNEIPYTVVGVLPAGFQGMSDKAQVWIPLSMIMTLPHQEHALDERKYRWLSVIGRLRSGQSVPGASREMEGLAAQLAREYPGTNGEIGATVQPLAQAWLGRVRPLLLSLLGGSILILLLIYGNLSTLWLAEGVARTPEITLRAALGASPGQLTRQTLTETLLLTLTGTAMGLAVSGLGMGAFVRRTGLPLRSFIHVDLDLFVVGAIVGLALACGLLFGLAPALLGTRAAFRAVSQGGDKTATAGRGRQRLQSLLIVYEVALAMILILAAGSLMADFQRRSRMDLGFRPDHLLTLRTTLQGKDYAKDERVRSMIREVTERLRSLPGVDSVAFAAPAIPTDPWHAFHITLEDRPDLDATGGPLILRHHVSPGYFKALRAPVVQGRDLSLDDDHGKTSVVLISRSLGRRFWPGQNPLGRRLKLGTRDSQHEWMTVVGVVEDIKHGGRGEEERPGPDLYLPILQSVPRTPPVLNLVVRVTNSPEVLAPAVIRELRRAAPGLPVYDVKTMEDRLTQQISETRILTDVMTGSALLALLLALIGIYGVLSYTVGQRARELGIRIALGATGKELVRLVVGHGLRLALFGACAGVALTLALNRLLAGFLHGIAPLASSLVAAVFILIACLITLACYIPVRKVIGQGAIASFLNDLWSGR